jgi:hypothetical protein
MKGFLLIIVVFLKTYSFAQENESDPEDITQQVEDLAEENIDIEDDFYLQQMEYYRKHRLNINEVDLSDLRELRILTDLQMQNFIWYRNLLGTFVSIYELQAIPSLDILTIKKLLPYITIADANAISQHIKERLKIGESSLMFRVSTIHPKSKGFSKNDSSENIYIGSRPAILMRYRYNYKNLVQYGILGDKDAGEQFLKGAQKKGFDHYSFHLIVRKLGIIKALALGDFTVNMGQGLVHWQSLAFKKGAAAVTIKRQSDIIRPFGSSGEYNFHRGAAISLFKNKWETTVFASIRKLSATIKTDSLEYKQGYISSLLNSGNHRTPAEIKYRNNLKALAFGGNIQYNSPRWHQGFSYVQYYFSKPFKPSDQPYNIFAVEGKKWSNLSLDYSYTFRNVHMYGEIAADENHNIAVINGIIASIDRSMDLALLHRRLDKRYQSLYGNAFTENTLPTNESGIYIGTSFRPSHRWKIDAYADFFRFPWLKFSAYAPGYGAEYLTQVTFTPSKQVELYIRYKKEVKHLNEDVNQPTSQLMFIPRRSLRVQISDKLNRQFLLRTRMDILWYRDEPDLRERGYLVYADLNYHSFTRFISGNTRVQYFETDGYNSRLYAYENDLLYSYNTPAFFEKGFRWYLNIRTDVSKWIFTSKRAFNMEVWMKYAITRYTEKLQIGSGLDEIQGNLRSEFKFLVVFSR